MHYTTNNLPYPAGHSPMTEKLPGFDPLQLMMKKKHQEESDDIPDVVKHNEDGIKELEEFCKQHNIMGFNCGRMNPKAALEMLKAKVGYVESKPKQLLKG